MIMCGSRLFRGFFAPRCHQCLWVPTEIEGQWPPSGWRHRLRPFLHMFPRNSNTIPQMFYDTTLASSPDIQWSSISLQETQVDSVEHMGDTHPV